MENDDVMWLGVVKTPSSSDLVPELAGVLALLPWQRRERLASRQREDFHAALAAEWLYRKGLSEISGVDSSCVKLNYDRDYVRIDSPEGFFCNGSHSGPWAAALLESNSSPSCTAISAGVDIEMESNISHDPEALLSCFTPEEIDWINGGRLSARILRLWTLKEAYLKALKVGVTPGSLQFAVKILDEENAQISCNPAFRFRSFYPEKGTVLSVAVEGAEPPAQFTECRIYQTGAS